MRYNIHFEIVFSQDIDDESFPETFDADEAANVVREVLIKGDPDSLATLSSVECLKVTKG